jgi:holin-like protein
MLLVKHLAFFFIPITIGLMDMGPLFALHGIGILITLSISAAVGMAMCGLTTQCLINAQSGSKARLGSEPNA